MDFENYTVDSERAEAIRNQLREIREKAQVGQIELLVNELGTEETDENAQASGTQPALLGFGKEVKSVVKTYRTGFTDNEIAHTVEVRQTDAEIKLLVDGRALVDFTALPKADEFLINRVDETRLALLPMLFESLGEELKKAKARKSERQAAWKARFNGG